MLAVLLLLYYILPEKHRWLVLLAGSACFYLSCIKRKLQLFVFIFSIVSSYIFSLIIDSSRDKPAARRKILLTLGVLISLAPLLMFKASDYLLRSSVYYFRFAELVPLGLSFYSLQVVSYLVDLYRGQIELQRNPLKYTLFISFFPHILQGPIPRYSQLGTQLFTGHKFDAERFTQGIQLIIWGFFLKLMIADKAAVFVDTVFGSFDAYRGLFVLMAGILYSFQLYTDFLSCVVISIGVSQLFGIQLAENFDHPYFSRSIKEFWRRWHMSLSSWLRDYVYIPLGGSRSGKGRKYLNLTATFLVSGFWHGGSVSFLLWGLMHAIYQIAGELTQNLQEKIYSALKMPAGSFLRVTVQRCITFFLVMVAWIVFRAGSLSAAAHAFSSMFSTFNPWIFSDGSFFRLGLNSGEFFVLFISLMVLLLISALQERGIALRQWVCRQSLPVRWAIYILAIVTIWVFGTYGFGFNANDFIYGGF